MNKGDLPLMYSCVCLCFFGKFIDLVGFLGGGGGGSRNNNQKNRLNQLMNLHQKTQECIKGNSPLFIFIEKKVKIMTFSVRRPQYFISHTNSQRLLDAYVGENRLRDQLKECLCVR